MIEPIMYLAIGFLVSMLLGLMIVPLVHNRAVRLTRRRLEDAAPLSMAEIQAEKDHLRAGFAMSARRLELNVDQLRNKTTSQAAELGKKTEAVQRMTLELDEKKAAIVALETTISELKGQLQSTEAEVAAKAQSLVTGGQALTDKQAELLKLSAELSNTALKADSRQVDLVAARAHIDALKNRVEDTDKELATTRQALERQRAETDSATRDLADARDRIENLSQRVAELDQQIMAQVKEAETLDKGIADLQAQLTAQTRTMSDREFDDNQLRQQNETLEAIARDLRVEVAALSSGKSPSLNKLQAAKSVVEDKLRAALEEKANLQRNLRTIQQQAEGAWATERTENAVLRERINDIAAEVARLAMQLEGPGSTIEAILTADRSGSQNDINGRVRAEAAAREPNLTLADRIRLLQSQTSKN